MVDFHYNISQQGLFFIALLSVLYLSCDINISSGGGDFYAPTIETIDVSNIGAFSAICEGNVIKDGGAEVTERGFVWSTETFPTLENAMNSSVGSGLGEFFWELVNLSPETTYYIRAFASNTIGTSYGSEITFTTLIDGSPQLKFFHYKLIYDNNVDEIVNKGETIFLKIDIENKGTIPAHGVQVSLNSNSPFINNISPSSLNYGEINYGEIISETSSSAPNSQAFSFKFTIDNSTPDNEFLVINLSMIDNNEIEYIDSFSVQVKRINAILEFDDYELIYDNNLDQIPNNGETIYLKIDVKNEGSSAALNVQTTLKSNNPFIKNILPNALNYGDINSGEIISETSSSAPNNELYSFKYEISESAPDGEIVIFSLNIQDGFTNEWEEEFEMTIKKSDPKIEFLDFSIVYDNNNNGLAEASETVYTSIQLVNIGTSNASDVNLSLSSANPHITYIVPSSLNYGDIKPLQIKTGQYSTAPNDEAYSFRIGISPNVVSGDNLEIPLTITDNFGNTWEDLMVLKIE